MIVYLGTNEYVGAQIALIIERPDVANKGNKSSTVSSRNAERDNGKAWGKNHNAKSKTLTVEQEARKIEKMERRASRRTRLAVAGPQYTMPKVTWDWATEMMVKRWPNTRRARIIKAVFMQEGRRVEETEATPETKVVKTSKRNGR